MIFQNMQEEAVKKQRREMTERRPEEVKKSFQQFCLPKPKKQKRKPKEEQIHMKQKFLTGLAKN